MQNIIDAIVSSTIIWFIIPFGIAIVVLVAMIWSDMSPIVNKIIYVICFILMMFPFVVGMWLKGIYGWGYAYNITELRTDDSHVYAVDSSISGGGRIGGSSTNIRMRALNKKTGEPLYRQVIGRLLAYQMPYAVYERPMAVDEHRSIGVIDLRSGEIRKYDKESLTKSVPELSSGVSKWEYDDNEHWIKIVTKKGEIYYMDPFKNEFFAQPPQLRIDASPMIYKEIRVSDVQSWILKGEQVKQIYTDDKQVLRNKKEIHKLSDMPLTDQKFLLGAFAYKDAQRVVIRHYETTDKANFTLTCLDLTGKTLWTLEQKDVGASDFFSHDPEFGQSTAADGNLIFSCGGFIISVNAETGKINWKSRI